MLCNKTFQKFSGLKQQPFIWLGSLPSGQGLARIAHLCSAWHQLVGGGRGNRRLESPGGSLVCLLQTQTAGAGQLELSGYLLFSFSLWSLQHGDSFHVHPGLPKPMLRERETERQRERERDRGRERKGEGWRTQLQPHHLLWPILGNYTASLALNFKWSVQFQRPT